MPVVSTRSDGFKFSFLWGVYISLKTLFLTVLYQAIFIFPIGSMPVDFFVGFSIKRLILIFCVGTVKEILYILVKLQTL